MKHWKSHGLFHVGVKLLLGFVGAEWEGSNEVGKKMLNVIFVLLF